MRLRVEYFDQNETFAPLLPRDGVVERTLRLAGSKGAWFLFRLDRPVSYNGVTYDRFLLKSRWAGYAIGGREPTSAFILLVPPAVEPDRSSSYKEFEHVAWGLVSTVLT